MRWTTTGDVYSTVCCLLIKRVPSDFVLLLRLDRKEKNNDDDAKHAEKARHFDFITRSH